MHARIGYDGANKSVCCYRERNRDVQPLGSLVGNARRHHFGRRIYSIDGWNCDDYGRFYPGPLAERKDYR